MNVSMKPPTTDTKPRVYTCGQGRHLALQVSCLHRPLSKRAPASLPGDGLELLPPGLCGPLGSEAPETALSSSSITNKRPLSKTQNAYATRVLQNVPVKFIQY